MATYFKGDVDVFPQSSFTPDYNFITAALEYRQKEYDQGFAQVKNSANSVINAQLTNEKNVEKRKMILSNAENAFKNLSSVDLSLSQNIDAAQSVFQPFYEDEGILTDIYNTKKYNREVQKAFSYRDSDKEDDRKRYWTTGVERIEMWREEFSKSDPSQLKSLQPPTYVAKPLVYEKVLSMFEKKLLNTSVDKESGKVLITDKNGQELNIGLSNLYLSLAENDPEAMEAYKVLGEVERYKWIKNNTERYGSKEAATQEFDAAVIRDYTRIHQTSLDEVNKSLEKSKAKYDAWQQNGNQPLTEQQAAQRIKDEEEYNVLVDKQKRYKTLLETAPKSISTNQRAYLGQMYLQKSANDLAKALSGFGSREFKTNPIYKDAVLPFELEKFKTDEQIRLEQAKSALDMQEESFKVDLSESGSGSSSSKGGSSIVGLKSLNIPIIEDNPAGSAVERRAGENELPDAYDQNIKEKRRFATNTAQTKLEYIESVLSNDEKIGPDGKLLTQNDRRNLISDGQKLDFLFKKAHDKAKALIASGDPRSTEYIKMYEKVDNLKNAWTAVDKYVSDNILNIVGNLEAKAKAGITVVNTNTKTASVSGSPNTFSYPDGNSLQNAKSSSAESNWFVYRNLINKKTGGLLDENKEAEFIQNLQKDPEFKKEIQRRYPASYNIPEVKNGIIKQYTNLFKKYRGDVVDIWNKEGYNFVTQNEASAGGGGVYARKVTFFAKSDVKGEEADKVTESLLKQSEVLSGSEDFIVAPGSTVPGADVKSLARKYGDLDKDFRGIIKNEIYNSIKLGKDANLKNYSITFSGVAGQKGEYNSYTIKLDADYIKTLSANKDDEKNLVKSPLSDISNGITIYVKKDKDQSLFAQRGQVGEVELRVNSTPTGVLEKEVAPGYSFKIERLVGQSGRYKITTNYPKVDAKSGEVKPHTEVVDVPENNDLTHFYYNMIENLTVLRDKTNSVMNNSNLKKPFSEYNREELIKKYFAGAK